MLQATEHKSAVKAPRPAPYHNGLARLNKDSRTSNHARTNIRTYTLPRISTFMSAMPLMPSPQATVLLQLPSCMHFPRSCCLCHFSQTGRFLPPQLGAYWLTSNI